MIFNHQPAQPTVKKPKRSGTRTKTIEEKSALYLGDFDAVIRELAEHNPSKIKEVMTWPVRDGLICLEHKIKQNAIETFKHQQLIWALLAPHCKDAEQPTAPDFLYD